MSFIEELKRRNVFRVGIAYAVSSWVLLQFADLVLENTEAPTWVMDVLFLFVGLGFIVALVVAWAFELTPEGIRREKDVDRSESATQETGRKLEMITLAAAALVLVLFVIDRVGVDQEVSLSEQVALSGMESDAGQENSAVDQDTAAMTDGAASPGDEAIELGVAVLPFENLSAEEGNAFFAGGVHEDVLSHISRINSLKVISRTSMIRIAERELDIPEIGRQLGVTHVLEGSVRRAGDQVRVTVQLIDAATDRHLWAENYDRRLDDIFAIQSEIASSIAAQLRTELSPRELARIEAVPTSNLQAYDLYLKARDMLRIWRGAEGFEDMRELLEEAVAIDPEFLDAKVMLASAYGRLVWARADPDGTYRKKAVELTEEIAQTFPDSTQAAHARANFRYLIMADYDQSLRDFEALVLENPNSIELLRAVSASYKRLGRPTEALPVIDRAIALDPENPSNRSERIIHLRSLGRHEQALSEAQTLMEQFEVDEFVALQEVNAVMRLIVFDDLDAWRNLRPDRIGMIDATDDGDVSAYGNGFERRLAVSEGHIERVLSGLEQSRSEDDEWQEVQIDVAAAESLNLVGREADSVARASSALAQLEARVAQGKPFPGIAPRYYLTFMAYTACLADRPEQAALLLGLASSMDHHDKSMVGGTYFEEMKARAECGAAEQAWGLAMLLAETETGALPQRTLQQRMFKYDPIYAHYFSEVPGWQQAVAPES